MTRSKRLFIRLLRSLSRTVLAKYHPLVVGVTGSVGKTSATAAIATVLGSTYAVGRPPKNYNTEIGLPLAVLQQTSPGRSPLGWLGVLRHGLWLIIHRGPYPEQLVLELGADHPGDLAYLVDLLQPKIGVVTAVGPAHLEFFETVDGVAREKRQLLHALPPDGVAVLNADDPLVMGMRQGTRAQVVTYGFAPTADVRAAELGYYLDEGRVGGMRCTVAAQAERAVLQLPQALGRHTVSSVLPAIAVGMSLNLTLAECAGALRQWQPQPGRMRLLAGIKGTWLIDDTYNASPLAVHAAVQVLREFPSGPGRKIAVLGDMLELGAVSESAHRELGEVAAGAGIDELVVVGERARDIARGAQAAGMPPERCFGFSDAVSAGQFLQNRIQPGDVVLIKASQGIRLERVVKELMAQPQRAGELLARQGPEWQ